MKNRHVFFASAMLCIRTWSFAFLLQAPRSRLSVPIRYSDVALDEHKQELKSRLPPIERPTMTKLEIEFRDLLSSLIYTQREMESISNPRVRKVFEGISASYYEPAVYRAFEVLFEDYIPLRVAGRIVYRKLQAVIDESNAYRQPQVESVVVATNLPFETVDKCYPLFVELAQDRSMATDIVDCLLQHGKQEGVFDVPAVAAKSNILELKDMQALVNPDGKAELSFEELITSLKNNLMKNQPAHVLQDLFQAEISHEHPNQQLSEKQQKFNQRYDDMLTQFAQWKDFIPSGEGRRLDILKGCFVGSENPKVVEALRVIYTDFAALRLSGDWIFSVVSALMNATMKRRNRKERKS